MGGSVGSSLVSLLHGALWCEVYGPYSSEQMQGWKEHGFFCAERVAYARVKDEDMFAAEETEFQEAHTMDFVA